MNSTPNIHLLPLSQAVSAAALLQDFPHGKILACDFAIVGAASWDERPWGYVTGRLSNIDHHADAPRMQRLVSSANLGLLWVKEQGRAPSSSPIVINHTDCDSVLSSAIVTGAVEPLPELGEAAIAADHTGQANDIADLLQALDSRRDYSLSLCNLRLLLAGQPLQNEAQVALDERLRQREAAVRLVHSGGFSRDGAVFYACVPRALDGEFFPALLPEAQVILLLTPHASPGRWVVKVRLGLAAPPGFSLHHLSIASFDPGYGGRWNAGSNKRGGVGTALTPEAYAHHLRDALME